MAIAASHAAMAVTTLLRDPANGALLISTETDKEEEAEVRETGEQASEVSLNTWNTTLLVTGAPRSTRGQLLQTVDEHPSRTHTLRLVNFVSPAMTESNRSDSDDADAITLPVPSAKLHMATLPLTSSVGSAGNRAALFNRSHPNGYAVLVADTQTPVSLALQITLLPDVERAGELQWTFTHAFQFTATSEFHLVRKRCNDECVLMQAIPLSPAC
jgi:hypothetical protein